MCNPEILQYTDSAFWYVPEPLIFLCTVKKALNLALQYMSVNS